MLCTAALLPAVILGLQDLPTVDQGRLGGQPALRLNLLQRRLLLVLAATSLLDAKVAIIHLSAQVSTEVRTDMAPLIAQL